MDYKAGRELDAQIAEKVFGLDPLLARHGLHENGDLEYSWGYPVGHDVAPSYSTDIAAAWTIVERMRTATCGPGFRLDWTPAARPGEAWLAEFGCDNYPDHGQRIVEAVGETAPLAICLAALNASGE